MLAVTLEANGWMVAFAVVVLIGMVVTGIFVAHTGRGISSKLVSIEGKSDQAATRADTAAQHAAVASAAVGTPNGKGNVVEMSEQLLALGDQLKAALADLRSQLTVVDRRCASVEVAQLSHGDRLAEVGSLGRETADAAQESMSLLHQHLAAHQAQHEADAAARRGEVDRRQT